MLDVDVHTHEVPRNTAAAMHFQSAIQIEMKVTSTYIYNCHRVDAAVDCARAVVSITVEQEDDFLNVFTVAAGPKHIRTI